MEFSIEEMYRHRSGFAVATVLSYRTQERSVLHNRYGSWMIGDPEAENGLMREAAVISYNLPAALQHRLRVEGDKIETRGGVVNIFLERAKAKRAKSNPFVAKAQKKNNPFLKLKKK